MLPTLFLMTLTAQYRVAQIDDHGVPVHILADTQNQVEVRVATTIGHNAYSMKIKGREIFWTPFAHLGEAKAKPALFGNPFLAPWANRIDGFSYFVNGKERKLNASAGTLRPDGNGNPIHGMVLYTDQWQVVEFAATDAGAVLRSKLDLGRNPAWMEQFPFAHMIEMTYRLVNGELEVITEIENQGNEPMPVAIGYHPYYRLDGGRDQWTATIAAREHVDLTPNLIPNGKRSPVANTQLPLRGNQLDDVYSSLVRNAKGEAEFAVSNGTQRLVFAFGPKYQVGVVYAPPGRDFICFEPMAAITDAFNQHHRGQYAELQSISPKSKWKESWWIRSSGF